MNQLRNHCASPGGARWPLNSETFTRKTLLGRYRSCKRAESGTEAKSVGDGGRSCVAPGKERGKKSRVASEGVVRKYSVTPHRMRRSIRDAGPQGLTWRGRQTIRNVDAMHGSFVAHGVRGADRERLGQVACVDPGIVMHDPRFRDQPQVRLGQWNQPVRAFAADGANDAFANGIGRRRTRRRF